MSKHRQAARIDDNQSEIIKQVKAMGATVQTGMDDVLVGFRGRTYWFEVKNPARVFKKDGTFKKGAIKDSQIKLAAEWKGHYQIVSNIDEIIKAIS